MRYLALFFLLIIAPQLYAQKDSCACHSLRPMPDYFSPGYAFARYKEYGKTTPYTGICHLYYMKVAYVQPDYERTYKYARFEKGELLFYIQFNDNGDTVAYFERVKKDSVIAIERKFDYFTGKLSSRTVYYYKEKGKYMKVYGYSPSGFLSSESNYFFPKKGDSLNYSGSHFIHYKKDSDLGRDGFYNTPVLDGRYFEYGGADGKVITVQGAYYHNYKTGDWTTRYESGTMKSEGAYVEYNWENGLWKRWYENTHLQSEIMYCRSGECGTYKEWYESGALMTTATYKYDRKIDGVRAEYWENGQLKKRDSAVDGIILRTEEWYASGQLQTFCVNDSEGKRNGIYKEWYESGVLRFEIPYRKGENSGPSREFYPNGRLTSEQEYINGVPSRRRTYYADGKLKSEELTDRYWLNGHSTYYFPSGKIWRDVNFKDGREEGREVIYGENGLVISEINYREGAWQDMCRWYHANGKLWREALYESGVRNGGFKEYNASGMLVYEQSYISGKPSDERKMKYVRSAAQVDWLRAVYTRDAAIMAGGKINDFYEKHLALYPSPALKERILNELVCVAAFLPAGFDSVAYVHFDSAYGRTHVYLDYVPSDWTQPGDTADCHPYPEAMNKFIVQMGFVPVRGECYGDDNGGIRRGFTTDQYFDAHILDSLLKLENPRFGCEYFGPLNNDAFSWQNGISVFMHDHYADYTYRLFLSKDHPSQMDYVAWTFRVYTDGSVDYQGRQMRRVMTNW